MKADESNVLEKKTPTKHEVMDMWQISVKMDIGV